MFLERKKKEKYLNKQKIHIKFLFFGESLSKLWDE